MSSPPTPPIPNEPFPTFFEGWFSRQKEFLKELFTFLTVPADYDDQSITDLLSRIGVHYYQYYQAKAALVQSDIHSVLFPTWLTPYERSFLWIGGFKPAVVFRLVSASDRLRLTPDQKMMMGRLEVEIRAEEAWLTGEFDRLQQGSILATEILAVVMGLSQDETAINTLESSIKTLVACADALRVKASTKLTDLLEPIQKVKFFAELAGFHVGRRMMGMRVQEMGMKNNIPN